MNTIIFILKLIALLYIIVIPVVFSAILSYKIDIEKLIKDELSDLQPSRKFIKRIAILVIILVSLFWPVAVVKYCKSGK